MILGHCHGEDYSNPAKELCGQALKTFNDVRALDVYFHYVVNANFYMYSLYSQKIMQFTLFEKSNKLNFDQSYIKILIFMIQD